MCTAAAVSYTVVDIRPIIYRLCTYRIPTTEYSIISIRLRRWAMDPCRDYDGVYRGRGPSHVIIYSRFRTDKLFKKRNIQVELDMRSENEINELCGSVPEFTRQTITVFIVVVVYTYIHTHINYFFPFLLSFSVLYFSFSFIYFFFFKTFLVFLHTKPTNNRSKLSFCRVYILMSGFRVFLRYMYRYSYSIHCIRIYTCCDIHFCLVYIKCT